MPVIFRRLGRPFSVAALLSLGFGLGGCALPPALSLANLAMSGLSYASTGKGTTDHLLSGAMDRDCALHRSLTEGAICVDAPNDPKVGPLADADPAPALGLGLGQAMTGRVFAQDLPPARAQLAMTSMPWPWIGHRHVDEFLRRRLYGLIVIGES